MIFFITFFPHVDQFKISLGFLKTQITLLGYPTIPDQGPSSLPVRFFVVEYFPYYITRISGLVCGCLWGVIDCYSCSGD